MTDFYGRLMIDLEGITLSDDDIALISNKHIGGIILFSRNFETLEQLKSLIIEIFAIKKNVIIAVDQEGGRVQRFYKDFTVIPSMQSLAVYAKEENDMEIFAETAWLISSELLAIGIDLNFAPVLDVDEKTSSVIGDRAFSNKVDEVIEFSSYFIDGMHVAGMSATGKHFPGHGGIFEDSHLSLVEDKRTFSDLLNLDIKPYIKLKNKLDAIMCAHVFFPDVDEKLPSFSKTWLQDILKNKLEFTGLIFSDDLSMKGSGDENCYIKTMKSFNAGCDMALICNDRDGVKDTISFLDNSEIKPSSKLSILKKKSNMNWDEIQSSEKIKNIRAKLKNIGR